jgi:hypothetical protein
LNTSTFAGRNIAVPIGGPPRRVSVFARLRAVATTAVGLLQCRRRDRLEVMLLALPVSGKQKPATVISRGHR